MSVRVEVDLNGVRVPLVLEDDALQTIAAAVGRDEPEASPWLTIATATTYLGLTEHAVRKLVDRGQIPKHQHVPGGRIMLRRDHLDTYLNGRRVNRA